LRIPRRKKRKRRKTKLEYLRSPEVKETRDENYKLYMEFARDYENLRKFSLVIVTLENSKKKKKKKKKNYL
jgi:hypothetical protein